MPGQEGAVEGLVSQTKAAAMVSVGGGLCLPQCRPRVVSCYVFACARVDYAQDPDSAARFCRDLLGVSHPLTTPIGVAVWCCVAASLCTVLESAFPTLFHRCALRVVRACACVAFGYMSPLDAVRLRDYCPAPPADGYSQAVATGVQAVCDSEAGDATARVLPWCSHTLLSLLLSTCTGAYQQGAFKCRMLRRTCGAASGCFLCLIFMHVRVCVDVPRAGVLRPASGMQVRSCAAFVCCLCVYVLCVSVCVCVTAHLLQLVGLEAFRMLPEVASAALTRSVDAATVLALLTHLRTKLPCPPDDTQKDTRPAADCVPLIGVPVFTPLWAAVLSAFWAWMGLYPPLPGEATFPSLLASVCVSAVPQPPPPALRALLRMCAHALAHARVGGLTVSLSPSRGGALPLAPANNAVALLLCLLVSAPLRLFRR